MTHSRIARRNFLLGTAAAGLGLSLGALPRLVRSQGQPLPTSFGRKVLNVTLEGGPDFRHLIVPAPNTDPASYGASYWRYRATAHRIDGSSTSQWMNRYQTEYLPVTSIGGTAVPEFGIHRRAGFLHAELVAGRAAIVSNVAFSENRDHAHSLLILQSGDVSTTASQASRDGWGGRLADHLSGNVFSMTRQKLLFCNLPLGSNSQVVSARDTRVFGLAGRAATDAVDHPRAMADRSLRSYYASLREANSVDPASSYHRFMEHERILRGLTTGVRARLEANPVPAEIAALFGNGGLLTRNGNFGEQMRNVYDCFACEDVTDTDGNPFGFRVASLNYGGWDSHKDQSTQIEPQFEEIFGTGRALDVLRGALADDMPAALDAYCVAVAGEFGRQLRSNGDRGTDHGRGNYVILMGNGVRGGVYGELFPMEEITTLVDGKNKYERYNQDIEGRTGLTRVLGAVSDWVANDDTAGDAVFASRATDPTEVPEISRAGLFVS